MSYPTVRTFAFTAKPSKRWTSRRSTSTTDCSCPCATVRYDWRKRILPPARSLSSCRIRVPRCRMTTRVRSWPNRRDELIGGGGHDVSSSVRADCAVRFGAKTATTRILSAAVYVTACSALRRSTTILRQTHCRSRCSRLFVRFIQLKQG